MPKARTSQSGQQSNYGHIQLAIAALGRRVHRFTIAITSPTATIGYSGASISLGTSGRTGFAAIESSPNSAAPPSAYTSSFRADLRKPQRVAATKAIGNTARASWASDRTVT